jgi:hypothetical protein
MKALVYKDIASLKKEPRFACELADEALYGMTVSVGEEAGEYVYVTTEYRYGGYVRKDELYDDEEGMAAWQSARRAWVTRPVLDVLQEPKVQSYPVITLTRGAQVIPGEQKDGWTQVTLIGGGRGYVRSSSLSQPIEDIPWQNREIMALRSDFVRTALSYLGTQYRWGGKTPLGIDCSGLCSMSYLLNGVTIYRDADIKEGFDLYPIDMDHMAQGDLILFPGHVAMYIGDGKYVHATAAAGSDGVVINSLRPGDPDFRPDLRESITAIGSIF